MCKEPLLPKHLFDLVNGEFFQLSARPPALGQACGLIFWLTQKRLVGSYFALSLASRS